MWGEELPDASSGSLWLNGHVAGATDARGTAGSRDGWHIADITFWGFMGNVLTTPPLIFVQLQETYTWYEHMARLKSYKMIGRNKGIVGNLSFFLEGSVQVLLAWGAGSWDPIGMNPHLELANTLLCYQGYTHTRNSFTQKQKNQIQPQKGYIDEIDDVKVLTQDLASVPHLFLTFLFPTHPHFMPVRTLAKIWADNEWCGVSKT